MRPVFYWRVWSDFIHNIQMRVLKHIKQKVEAAAQVGAGA